jgi:hypothetical protein
LASKDVGHQALKNIFKKGAKIPPGEIQTRGSMIKYEPTIKNEKLKMKNERLKINLREHHARKLQMAEEQYERREKEAESNRLLKLQSAMKKKPLIASIDGNSDEAWQWADWVIRVAHGLPMPEWWTNPTTAEEWSELLMPYWRSKWPVAPSPTKSHQVAPKKRKGAGVEPPSSDFGVPRGPGENASTGTGPKPAGDADDSGAEISPP